MVWFINNICLTVCGCFGTQQIVVLSAADISCTQYKFVTKSAVFRKTRCLLLSPLISDRYKFQHSSTTSQARQGKQVGECKESQFGNNKQRGHSFINMI